MQSVSWQKPWLEAFRLDGASAMVLQQLEGASSLRVLLGSDECQIDEIQHSSLCEKLKKDELLVVTVVHGYFGTDRSVVVVNDPDDLDKLKSIQAEELIRIVTVAAIAVNCLKDVRETFQKELAHWIWPEGSC